MMPTDTEILEFLKQYMVFSSKDWGHDPADWVIYEAVVDRKITKNAPTGLIILKPDQPAPNIPPSNIRSADTPIEVVSRSANESREGIGKAGDGNYPVHHTDYSWSPMKGEPGYSFPGYHEFVPLVYYERLRDATEVAENCSQYIYRAYENIRNDNTKLRAFVAWVIREHECIEPDINDRTIVVRLIRTIQEIVKRAKKVIS